MTDKRLGNTWTLKWTPPHDAALRRLHEAGDSCSQSAAKLNHEFHTVYTRNAVIGRKHRLGMTEPMTKRTPRAVKAAKKPHHSDTKPRAKWSAPQPDRAEIILRCAEVIPLNLTLAELDQATQCHYIAGDDRLYCGHPSLPDLPYCLAHMRLSRRPT